MNRFAMGLYIVLAFIFPSQLLLANPDTENNTPFLSGRHIMMLQADLDYIWGSYYFAVTNPGSKEALFRAPMTLPVETIDFRAQDGLSDQDLKLDKEGHLYVEKEFRPGLNLLGIGFKIRTSSKGADHLTIKALTEIAELSVASPKNSGLSFSASGFREGLPPMLAGGSYRGMISEKPTLLGEELKITVHGIPKGRSELIQLASAVMIALLAGSIALTIRTHRQRRKESDSTQLTDF